VVDESLVQAELHVQCDEVALLLGPILVDLGPRNLHDPFLLHNRVDLVVTNHRDDLQRALVFLDGHAGVALLQQRLEFAQFGVGLQNLDVTDLVAQLFVVVKRGTLEHRVVVHVVLFERLEGGLARLEFDHGLLLGD